MSSKDKDQDHLSAPSGPCYMDEEKEEEQAEKRYPGAVAVSAPPVGVGKARRWSPDEDSSTEPPGALRMAYPGTEPVPSIAVANKKKKSDNNKLRMAPGVERVDERL